MRAILLNVLLFTNGVQNMLGLKGKRCLHRPSRPRTFTVTSTYRRSQCAVGEWTGGLRWPSHVRWERHHHAWMGVKEIVWVGVLVGAETQ